MIADTVISDTTTWQDLNTLTGIAVGTALIIVNKLNLSSPPIIWIGASAPANTAYDGVPVVYGSPYALNVGAAKCWVRSSGGQVVLNVQSA